MDFQEHVRAEAIASLLAFEAHDIKQHLSSGGVLFALVGTLERQIDAAKSRMFTLDLHSEEGVKSAIELKGLTRGLMLAEDMIFSMLPEAEAPAPTGEQTEDSNNGAP